PGALRARNNDLHAGADVGIPAERPLLSRQQARADPLQLEPDLDARPGVGAPLAEHAQGVARYLIFFRALPLAGRLLAGSGWRRAGTRGGAGRGLRCGRVDFLGLPARAGARPRVLHAAVLVGPLVELCLRAARSGHAKNHDRKTSHTALPSPPIMIAGLWPALPA